MKARLNSLKKREWYRPVARVVAAEAAARVFGRPGVRSPYMSFAPALRADAAARCPAMTPYDRSSRPQTVAAADDAWLHALLLAVGALTRCEALINTSFNARGRPILNSIADALGLLRTADDLDSVLELPGVGLQLDPQLPHHWLLLLSVDAGGVARALCQHRVAKLFRASSSLEGRVGARGCQGRRREARRRLTCAGHHGHPPLQLRCRPAAAGGRGAVRRGSGGGAAAASANGVVLARLQRAQRSVSATRRRFAFGPGAGAGSPLEASPARGSGSRSVRRASQMRSASPRMSLLMMKAATCP